MRMSLFYLAVTMVMVNLANSGCPFRCTCRGQSVDCSSRGLKIVPKNIPQNTTSLVLQGNEIQIIDELAFVNLTNLKTLNIRYNKIRNIHGNAFKNLRNLTVLDISSNYVSNLSSEMFATLQKLSNLDLSQNKIKSLDGVFRNLHKLYRLDLASNKIEKISGNDFEDLHNVIYLLLSDNKISIVDQASFHNLTSMSYLMLRKNQISKLDDTFAANRRLSYIDISDCKLRNIPSGLPWSLRYLHLGNNTITTVTKVKLSKIKFLSILVLDQNNIDHIEDRAFTDMLHLHELWLNDNKLKILPGNLPIKLKNVYADVNEIVELQTDLFQTASLLETLSLKNNKINKLVPDTFVNLTKLKKLYLNGNNISAIEPFMFRHTTNLEWLTMNRIQLTTIHRDSFSGLRSLSHLELAFISSDHVTVDSNAFYPLTNLTNLDIQSFPALAKILIDSDDMLKSLSSVEDLNLMDNSLTTMKPTINQFMRRLKNVKLAENRWRCDQDLRWLSHWLQSDADKFYLRRQVICSSPASLKRRPIYSLSANDFVPIMTIPPSTSPPTSLPVITDSNSPTMTVTKTIGGLYDKSGSTTSKVTKEERTLRYTRDRSLMTTSIKGLTLKSTSMKSSSIWTKHPPKSTFSKTGDTKVQTEDMKPTSKYVTPSTWPAISSTSISVTRQKNSTSDVISQTKTAEPITKSVTSSWATKSLLPSSTRGGKSSINLGYQSSQKPQISSTYASLSTKDTSTTKMVTMSSTDRPSTTTQSIVTPAKQSSPAVSHVTTTQSTNRRPAFDSSINTQRMQNNTISEKAPSFSTKYALPSRSMATEPSTNIASKSLSTSNAMSRKSTVSYSKLTSSRLTKLPHKTPSRKSTRPIPKKTSAKVSKSTFKVTSMKSTRSIPKDPKSTIKVTSMKSTRSPLVMKSTQSTLVPTASSAMTKSPTKNLASTTQRKTTRKPSRRVTRKLSSPAQVSQKLTTSSPKSTRKSSTSLKVTRKLSSPVQLTTSSSKSARKPTTVFVPSITTKIVSIKPIVSKTTANRPSQSTIKSPPPLPPISLIPQTSTETTTNLLTTTVAKMTSKYAKMQTTATPTVAPPTVKWHRNRTAPINNRHNDNHYRPGQKIHVPNLPEPMTTAIEPKDSTTVTLEEEIRYSRTLENIKSTIISTESTSDVDENSIISSVFDTTTLSDSNPRETTDFDYITESLSTDLAKATKVSTLGTTKRNIRFFEHDELPIPRHNRLPSVKQDDSNEHYRAVKVISIATSLSVVVLVLIFLVGLFILCQHRKRKVVFHRQVKYKENKDVTFFVNLASCQSYTPFPKSRSERKSSSNSRIMDDINCDNEHLAVEESSETLSL